MDLWREIKELEGQTLHTLKQKKPFDLLKVSYNKVIIRPQAKMNERSIPWEEISGSWLDLLEHGKITRKEIQSLVD